MTATSYAGNHYDRHLAHSVHLAILIAYIFSCAVGTDLLQTVLLVAGQLV